MGQMFELKCASCDYGIAYTKGVGMMDSPDAVFYGCCEDSNPTQRWSVAFPYGFCEDGKPRLRSFVKSKRVRDKAFDLLNNGAVPDEEYGYELFVCPKCNRLKSNFFFRLHSSDGDFEPDYRCVNCRTTLQRVELNTDDDDRCDTLHITTNQGTWKCPECGCEELKCGSRFIMWD